MMKKIPLHALILKQLILSGLISSSGNCSRGLWRPSRCDLPVREPPLHISLQMHITNNALISLQMHLNEQYAHWHDILLWTCSAKAAPWRKFRCFRDPVLLHFVSKHYLTFGKKVTWPLLELRVFCGLLVSLPKFGEEGAYFHPVMPWNVLAQTALGHSFSNRREPFQLYGWIW